MNPIKGTPRTLREAVFNSYESRGEITTAAEVDDIVEHVQDFLANKFGVPMATDWESEVKKIFEIAPSVQVFSKTMAGIVTASFHMLYEKITKK